jgi:hypothetical protein
MCKNESCRIKETGFYVMFDELIRSNVGSMNADLEINAE